MTLISKIENLQKASNHAGFVERIIAQINFATELSVLENGKYDDVINSAVDYLLNEIENNGALTKQNCQKAEEMIIELSKIAKGYKVHCVSHAHIDMNWMWGYQETASITVDTFRTVLDLMAEYPQFTFGQSQASTYKIIQDFAPEMIDEIKKYVKEGRFEVTASTWVETDKNMPSGESLARHILYTKRYLSKLLDIPSSSMELDFEPDTFGHNISVPEICKKGGVKYYYHCRGSVEDPNRPAYVWRARSGESLLVWRDPQWYNGGVGPEAFMKVPEVCNNNKIKTFLYVYGVGDHGGGPTRRDINKIIEISKWPVMPKIEFSTYKQFFKELEEYKDELPVREGEMNFVFTGCYTSQARIKMANRIAEDRIYEAETISAMANILADAPKRNDLYEKAWEKILFNHFHDILPGSGVVDTREHAMGEFQNAMAGVMTGTNTAMRALAQRIDTSSLKVEESEPNFTTSEGAGVGFFTSGAEHYKMPITERGNGKRRIFHVFNPTEYNFKGVCEIIVWDWNYNAGRAVFKNSKGEVCPHMLLENSRGYWDHEFKKFALFVNVDAFGYATFTLDEEEKSGIAGYSLLYPRVENSTDSDIVMENDKIKVVFDHATMEIKSLINKSTGENTVKAPTGYFNFIKENPRQGMTSWRVGEYMTVENLNKSGVVRIKDMSLGGMKKWIRYEVKFGERSKINVCAVLYDNRNLVEYELKVDFHEVGVPGDFIPQLSFAFPIGYEAKSFRYDVPFGVIDRAGCKHDVPANSFAAAINPEGEDKASMMLLSDSKYGFRCYDDTMTLTLIRASYDPDPYPEYGMHNIRIGFGVVNSAKTDDLYGERAVFIHPLSMCSTKAKKGDLSLDGRLFSVQGEVNVGAVKNAEDTNALVVRLYEAKGKTTDFTLEFEKDILSVSETDINEAPINELEFEGSRVNATIDANSIKTLLVKFK